MTSKESIINSFIWVSVERISTIGLLFIGTIVLAHFLSPSAFGLVGILTIFTAISMMLIDSGMGGSLIKEKNVSESDYSTLFIYNVGISIIIYLILYFSSGYVAELYCLPELKDLLRILSLTIIFNAVSIVQRIKLTRSFDFKVMCIITVISMLFAILISILLAYKGFGVWALIMQQVLQSLFNSLFYFIYVRFIPSFVFDRKSFRKHFAFGANLMCATLINTVNTNISSSIIGKFFSLQQTGFFAQSNKLYTMPTNIVSSIVDKAVFPILSKKNDLNEIISTISMLSRNIYLITFPLFSIVIVLSSPIIVTFLGDEWQEAAWILSRLCCGGIPLVVKLMLRNALKTLGETYCIFKCEFICFIIGLVILLVSASISFRAIIWGVVCNNIILMIAFMIAISKKINYSIKMQVCNILPFLLCSIVASIMLFFVMHMIETSMQPVFVLLIGLFLGVILVVLSYVAIMNREALNLIHRLFAYLR